MTMTQLLAEPRAFEITDSKVLIAFAMPDEYDWSLPDQYETAVFDALETGQGLCFGFRSELLATALRQTEPIRILPHGCGWKVTRPI